MAIDISINAKTNRPSVCNAMESLLVHKDIANIMLPALKEEFDKKETLLKGCEETRKYIDIEIASDKDFATEFLDNILSIKVVSSVEDACLHIEKYGSHHSECIVTNDIGNANSFLANIDAACVHVNASTRFSDGFSFGFGGEIGISTSKLHARGPMGLDELVSYKYQIVGNGQIK
jgi:glutamate-5-semialdehyde dehydrogenase